MQNQYLIFPIRRLFVTLGLVTIAVSVFADLTGFGNPGFGIMQSLTLVFGAILCMISVLNDSYSISKILARIMSAIYLSLILFIGLIPRSVSHPYHYKLLGFNEINSFDLLINFMGFIPLGYLLMVGFGNRLTVRKINIIKSAFIVTGFGALISFFLESSQYYFIPGRFSSSIDLIANIVGTFIGVSLFFLMGKSKKLEETTGLSFVTN